MSFIHSKDYVTDLDEDCIQPNAVDLRVKQVEEFVTYDGHDDTYQHWNQRPVVKIGSVGKQFALRQSPERYYHVDGNGWILKPRTAYDVRTKHSIKVPEGMVGWCRIRSTLSRNGLILSGGLYDAGYDGTIGFTIHNLTDNIIQLEEDVRVAQFILAHSETAKLYDGYYNHNGGGHSK